MAYNETITKKWGNTIRSNTSSNVRATTGNHVNIYVTATMRKAREAFSSYALCFIRDIEDCRLRNIGGERADDGFRTVDFWEIVERLLLSSPLLDILLKVTVLVLLVGRWLFALWLITPSLFLWFITPSPFLWLITPSLFLWFIAPSLFLWLITPSPFLWFITPSASLWYWWGSRSVVSSRTVVVSVNVRTLFVRTAEGGSQINVAATLLCRPLCIKQKNVAVLISNPQDR